MSNMANHDERLLERYPGPDPSEAMIQAGMRARCEQWMGTRAHVIAIWRAMQGAAEARGESEAREVLAPCPFCNGEAAIDDVSTSYRADAAPMWGVGCNNDRCSVDAHSVSLDRTKAVTAWNTRALSTPVQSAASTFHETGEALKVAEAVREAAARMAENAHHAIGLSWTPKAIAAAIRAMTLNAKGEDR